MKHIILTLLTLLTLASCSMMSDSRINCPACETTLHVTLRYDYNIQRANMFSDHVGAVTCYLLTPEGKVVDSQTAQNDETQQPLKSSAFAFNFDDIEEGDYRLMAIASQRPDDPARPITPNVTTLQPGDDISALRIFTPRNATPNPDGTHNISNAAPLDTVWHALNEHTVHVNYGETAYDTLSLMRLTNNLNVMLVQSVNPTDNQADNYDVRIVDRNGLLNYDATQLPDQSLLYTPYAAWTTETLGEIEEEETPAPAPAPRRAPSAAPAASSRAAASPAASPASSASRAAASPAASPAAVPLPPSSWAATESQPSPSPSTRATGVTARTAHYDLSFPRLFSHPNNTASNPRLQIINKADGQTILDIDLVYYLALARTASERIYPTQEFLDREYNYRLDVYLAGNEWRYINLSISLLSWSLRIQNTAL